MMLKLLLQAVFINSRFVNILIFAVFFKKLFYPVKE